MNLKWQNISTGFLYTRTAAAKWLFEQNITTVGTAQKKRTRIWPEFFVTKNSKVFSKAHCFEKEKKDSCLTSYTVQSKSKSRKKISCPSNIKTSPLFPKNKQQIYKVYDFTKDGTDILAQLYDYYNSRAKSLRWVMIALHYMLDTARINYKPVWGMEEKINAYRLSSLWLLTLELSEVFPNPSRNIILKKRFFRAIALTEPENLKQI